MKKIILTAFGVLLLCSTTWAAQLKLTTYYPAPNMKGDRGSFNRLTFNPLAAPLPIGDCTATTAGLTYYDASSDTLLTCNSLGSWTKTPGVWKQIGDNIVLSDTVNPFAKKVAIGTQTPEMTLTMYGDGGIISTGNVLAGADLTSSGGGTRLIWWPKMAALRAGQVSFTNWDAANIGVFSMALGFNPKASGGASAVMGGASNTASATDSFVGGGANNAASGERATIIGGANNIASGVRSFVGGGGDYDVPASRNTASGQNAAVVGGGGNLASGVNSFIGGGSENVASGDYSFIGGGSAIGGEKNTAGGLGSAIIGGGANGAGGKNSAVVGGAYNYATGENAFIGGGAAITEWHTEANGKSSGVIGGYRNITSNLAENSVILGGEYNGTGANNAAVLGGKNNGAGGLNSVVLGGARNSVTGNSSVIAGGVGNSIESDYSFIGGATTDTTWANMHLAPGADNTFVWGYTNVNGFNINTARAALFFPDAVNGPGRVGIGTATPSEPLEVVGKMKSDGLIVENPTGQTVLMGEATGDNFIPISITNGAYSDGASWVDGSSREYKKDIAHLTADEAIQAFAKLEPVTYHYKKDQQQNLRVGFIAEDVPELVATADRKGLSPLDIVAVLTKVVQEQQKMLEEQQKEIDALKTKINGF